MYTISTEKSELDIDMIVQYLSEDSYWAQDRTKDMIQESINNSLCYGIYKDCKQIGFARVITDFVVFGWLLDVFILPGYQGCGVGKYLLKAIMEDEKLINVKRWRLATADAHGFYEQFGFKSPANPEYIMEK
ncbi:GNAT family N-acetyltransferase [Carboxylicivirga caseinilyticus]|uniref:GNAT family N-acetyltransferase n=1 Tax=Carboxylicivirga caseinilyticus TaxID=3417572 RepID=UPI003D345183|nr:GNAT family N-acetyltransferase [Marinilabiliaceae bacterium A049]